MKSKEIQKQIKQNEKQIFVLNCFKIAMVICIVGFAVAITIAFGSGV